MSTVNLNIVAEFDLKELEKAKKRMEEIEDIFLKWAKLSKIDFAKSFEKFSKSIGDFIKIYSTLKKVSKDIEELFKEIAGPYTEPYLRNIEDVMKSLDYGMERGSKNAKLFHEEIMKGANLLKKIHPDYFLGFDPKKAEKQALQYSYMLLRHFESGWAEQFDKLWDNYSYYLKCCEEGFKRVEKGKIYSLKIQLDAEQDIFEAMKSKHKQYSKVAMEEQKARVQGIKDEIAGINSLQQYLPDNQDFAAVKARTMADSFTGVLDMVDEINLALIDMRNMLENLIWQAAELSQNLPDLPYKGSSAGASASLIPDKSPAFFAGQANALPDSYSKKDTSKQYDAEPPWLGDYGDDYEFEHPEKAPGEDTKKGSGFFGGMKDSFWSGVDKLKQQFGLGGDKGMLGNLFGGKDTGGGLLGMLGSFAGPQSGLVGTIQQFASMLPGIGGMISNIIGGIATAFNALKSLFGGLTEEEKVCKDVTRDLGVEISKDLAKKIAETSKDIGDRFTAVTLHLGDIMRETDITADNFDSFASRARDVFSLLETGMMDSAQATSTLNDVFPQLAEEADKLGITFNKNMIDMIKLSRQFGLEVEAISEYVEEKLGVAIGGIGDFIKDINTELFLFIKYNYSLQHRYAKESNVGIGFIPVRAAQWDAYKY